MLDLSYLAEAPSEAQEEAVREAVEKECLRAISTYLTEVAATMDTNNIPHITADNLRSMASTLFIRIDENAQDESTSSD
jgi:hypothetical protein